MVRLTGPPPPTHPPESSGPEPLRNTIHTLSVQLCFPPGVPVNTAPGTHLSLIARPVQQLPSFFFVMKRRNSILSTPPPGLLKASS